MDISKLSKAKVLADLFNAALPQGLGFLQYEPHHIMTELEAAELLKTQTYFDYLEGRAMKVNLSGNDLNTHLYNRDNGHNAAENALEYLFAQIG